MATVSADLAAVFNTLNVSLSPSGRPMLNPFKGNENIPTFRSGFSYITREPVTSAIANHPAIQHLAQDPYYVDFVQQAVNAHIHAALGVSNPHVPFNPPEFPDHLTFDNTLLEATQNVITASNNAIQGAITTAHPDFTMNDTSMVDRSVLAGWGSTLKHLSVPSLSVEKQAQVYRNDLRSRGYTLASGDITNPVYLLSLATGESTEATTRRLRREAIIAQSNFTEYAADQLASSDITRIHDPQGKPVAAIIGDTIALPAHMRTQEAADTLRLVAESGDVPLTAEGVAVPLGFNSQTPQPVATAAPASAGVESSTTPVDKLGFNSDIPQPHLPSSPEPEKSAEVLGGNPRIHSLAMPPEESNPNVNKNKSEIPWYQRFIQWIKEHLERRKTPAQPGWQAIPPTAMPPTAGVQPSVGMSPLGFNSEFPQPQPVATAAPASAGVESSTTPVEQSALKPHDKLSIDNIEAILTEYLAGVQLSNPTPQTRNMVIGLTCDFLGVERFGPKLNFPDKPDTKKYTTYRDRQTAAAAALHIVEGLAETDTFKKCFPDPKIRQEKLAAFTQHLDDFSRGGLTRKTPPHIQQRLKTVQEIKNQTRNQSRNNRPRMARGLIQPDNTHLIHNPHNNHPTPETQPTTSQPDFITNPNPEPEL